jgi:transcriptional regulator of acetoin/glycerol metabolism
VIQYLTNYDWPGNVRELQNVVERMINICNGNTITVEHLPQEILNQFTTVNNNSAQTLSRGASVNMQRQRQKQMQGLMEQEEIIKLLGKYGGNITRVAQEMGISRNTVYRKMKKYNIEI